MIPKTVPAKIANIHIWDTLGQEKFKTIVRLFYRGTVGAVLVFDLNKRESFDALPEWHKTIIDSCDSSVVISLVGSRCDQPTRAVSYEEA